MNEVGQIAISAQKFYGELLDDCEGIVTEAVFTSRWALVEGYWTLGQRIAQDAEKAPITELLQALAEDLKTGERTLWYAVQMFRKYPQLDTVPEGKNISWNKLITKYLPAPKKETECNHEWEDEVCERCTICGKKRKKGEGHEQDRAESS